MIDKVFNLEPFQSRFMLSRARYPAMVAAWATGKTMVALLKIYHLAEAYKNNICMVVRKKFTDLRDSTMKDFERYTGLRVKVGNKNVVLPNGSEIRFRHGDELSGLQNVNLGAWMIEQAEEFQSDKEFQLLRGRLRREGCFRQGIVIANTRGHNWIWRKWKKPHDAGKMVRFDFDTGIAGVEYENLYELIEAKTKDNVANIPADFYADLMQQSRESPEIGRQYVENSWEDFDLAGAYYATLMSEALSSGRIGNVPHDAALQVHTSWDFGYGDATAIWFFQLCGQEIHLIDYYENSGEAMAHYVRILEERQKQYNYMYGTHLAPHDVKAGSLQTGTTLLKTARALGIVFKPLERERRVTEGIERVRNILHRCWFDAKKCEHGIECLECYCKEFNDSLRCYSREPLHDWTSHGADSFRYMSKGLPGMGAGGGGIMTIEQVRRLHAQHRRMA